MADTYEELGAADRARLDAYITAELPAFGGYLAHCRRNDITPNLRDYIDQARDRFASNSELYANLLPNANPTDLAMVTTDLNQMATYEFGIENFISNNTNLNAAEFLEAAEEKAEELRNDLSQGPTMQFGYVSRFASCVRQVGPLRGLEDSEVGGETNMDDVRVAAIVTCADKTSGGRGGGD